MLIILLMVFGECNYRLLGTSFFFLMLSGNVCGFGMNVYSL
jgi:hypothetical protein